MELTEINVVAQKPRKNYDTGISAMQIRLFIATLALVLCVIAARADKPIVIKDSEATCPRGAFLLPGVLVCRTAE